MTSTFEDNPTFFDDAYFADPAAALTAAAARAPVVRTLSLEGEPVWVVTRPEHVVRLLDDPALSVDKRQAAPGFKGFNLPPALDTSLLNTDGEAHARLRRLVAPTFSARRIQALHPAVQAIADRLLDDLTQDGEVDLITAYATPLPITVICELLGIPEKGRADFKTWTDTFVAPNPTTPDEARRDAAIALYLYIKNLIDTKRAAPADDLLSALVTARDDGDALTEDELTSMAFLVLGAGYETTANLIATSTLMLLTRPDLRATIRQNPDALPGIIEEVLRLEGPAALAIRRFATHDLDIDSITIPAHSTILLGLAAAHRDPERYPHPDHLDADRASRHFSFGHGAHFCLGASLARMETRIAVSALLARYPDLGLAVSVDHLTWRRSTMIRGLKVLPVMPT